MDMMREIERTEELLNKGLKEINDKGELNNPALDLLGKTIDAIKDLCEIKKDNEMSKYGSSGMWTAEGSYGRMVPEYRWSYGRRDGDGDGRYYEGHYGRHYGHNEDMVESLRREMQSATSEAEKEAIRKLIRKYENN